MTAQQLQINNDKLDQYRYLSQINLDDIPPEHIMSYKIAQIALKSKQCNEPYENLLADILGLEGTDKKHGWDAFDNKDSPNEYYEFKPTSGKSATINDDTEAKIIKYEEVIDKGKKVWLVYALINKNIYSFDKIYKFPAEIYNSDRRNYVSNLEKKNAITGKNTRSTYSISASKSIKFCKEQGKTYYVWERSN